MILSHILTLAKYIFKDKNCFRDVVTLIIELTFEQNQWQEASFQAITANHPGWLLSNEHNALYI